MSIDLSHLTAPERATASNRILAAIRRRFPGATSASSLRNEWPAPKPPQAVLWLLLDRPLQAISDNEDLFLTLPKILSATGAQVYGDALAKKYDELNGTMSSELALESAADDRGAILDSSIAPPPPQHEPLAETPEANAGASIASPGQQTTDRGALLALFGDAVAETTKKVLEALVPQLKALVPDLVRAAVSETLQVSMPSIIDGVAERLNGNMPAVAPAVQTEKGPAALANDAMPTSHGEEFTAAAAVASSRKKFWTPERLREILDLRDERKLTGKQIAASMTEKYGRPISVGSISGQFHWLKIGVAVAAPAIQKTDAIQLPNGEAKEANPAPQEVSSDTAPPIAAPAIPRPATTPLPARTASEGISGGTDVYLALLRRAGFDSYDALRVATEQRDVYLRLPADEYNRLYEHLKRERISVIRIGRDVTGPLVPPVRTAAPVPATPRIAEPRSAPNGHDTGKGSARSLDNYPFFKSEVPELLAALQSKGIRTRSDLVKKMVEKGLKEDNAQNQFARFCEGTVMDTRKPVLTFTQGARLIAEIAGLTMQGAYGRQIEAHRQQKEQAQKTVIGFNRVADEAIKRAATLPRHEGRSNGNGSAPHMNGGATVPEVRAATAFGYRAVVPPPPPVKDTSPVLADYPFAKQYLAPVLSAYAGQRPPIASEYNLAEKLKRAEYGRFAIDIERLFDGCLDIFEQRAAAPFTVTPAAVVMASIAGLHPQLAYRGIPIDRRARDLRPASSAAAPAVQDNERLFEQLCEAFPALQGTGGVDGIYALVKGYWDDRATFEKGLRDLAETRQPNDALRGGLKPLAKILQMVIPGANLFQEHGTQTSQQRERHGFGGLMSRYAGTSIAASFKQKLESALRANGATRGHLENLPTYMNLFNGKDAPVEGGRLTRHAAFLMDLMKLPSLEVIMAVPELSGSLVYSDMVRRDFPNLAHMMRHFELFTVSAFRACEGGEHITPQIERDFLIDMNGADEGVFRYSNGSTLLADILKTPKANLLAEERQRLPSINAPRLAQTKPANGTGRLATAAPG